MRTGYFALISFRWHLPTLPLVTAVPSAVRGLTALFEMEEVNTRLTSTNLIDPSDSRVSNLRHFLLLSQDLLLSFSPQRETLIHFQAIACQTLYRTLSLSKTLNTRPGPLVRLGLTHLYAYTYRLSTSSSTTPLYTGTFIFRPVSHLDAFSAYLFPT